MRGKLVLLRCLIHRQHLTPSIMSIGDRESVTPTLILATRSLKRTDRSVSDLQCQVTIMQLSNFNRLCLCYNYADAELSTGHFS